MKKGQNVRGLKPVSYTTYRKLRAFTYPTEGVFGTAIKDHKPACYKDGNRVKFCMWMGGRDKWEKYAKSLGLKKGIHYVHEESESWRGPYPVTILYVEE